MFTFWLRCGGRREDGLPGQGVVGLPHQVCEICVVPVAAAGPLAQGGGEHTGRGADDDRRAQILVPVGAEPVGDDAHGLVLGVHPEAFVRGEERRFRVEGREQGTHVRPAVRGGRLRQPLLDGPAVGEHRGLARGAGAQGRVDPVGVGAGEVEGGVLLAAEVAAEGAARDVGAVGDGLHGDGPQTPLQHEPDGRGGERFPGLPGLALPTVLGGFGEWCGVVRLHVFERTPMMSQ